jgi:hypothetical protein
MWGRAPSTVLKTVEFEAEARSRHMRKQGSKGLQPLGGVWGKEAWGLPFPTFSPLRN